MKNLSFLLLMPFMLLFASCDQCEKTDCGPNGNCSQGECFCDTGYYGDNCENGYIDQILDKGNWLSNLYVDNADEEFLDAYGTSVQADASNPLKFYIPGFYQYEGNNISMSGIVQDNWNVTFP
ncbi:MAG: hypothetical protein KDC34_15500, partial [Saprospiraceae bacterium]|nr:hypothetical protein [Saprospiraceae bacterium]